MLDNGPVCVCYDGYVQYEDGACLIPITDPVISDPDPAVCDVYGAAGTSWYNSDTPDNAGDWETLGNFAGTDVCSNPLSMEAQRTDGSTSALILHINKVRY